MNNQISNTDGAHDAGVFASKDLFSEFRARNGFDLTIPEATAGSGCLVGHSKTPRQNKTTQTSKWATRRAWLKLTRSSRTSAMPTAKLPCWSKVNTRSVANARYSTRNVAASKTQPSAVRNLLAGGRCAGNGAPQKACNSVTMESSKTRVQFPPRPPLESAGYCLRTDQRPRNVRLPATHSLNDAELCDGVRRHSQQ